MIGKPEEEWSRRLKQVEMTNEELKEDKEFQQQQCGRKKRQELRKRLTWDAIFIASIPVTLKRKCKNCLKVYDFEHVEKYISRENKDLVKILKSIITGENPIENILNLNRDEGVKEIWKIYSRTFVNKKTNVDINSEKEEDSGKE